jgi:hypothetical protein
VIHFASNSWDLTKKVSENVNGKDVEHLYDPSAPAVIEEIESWRDNLVPPVS